MSRRTAICTFLPRSIVRTYVHTIHVDSLFFYNKNDSVFARDFVLRAGLRKERVMAVSNNSELVPKLRTEIGLFPSMMRHKTYVVL